LPYKIDCPEKLLSNSKKQLSDETAPNDPITEFNCYTNRLADTKPNPEASTSMFGKLKKKFINGSQDKKKAEKEVRNEEKREEKWKEKEGKSKGEKAKVIIDIGSLDREFENKANSYENSSRELSMREEAKLLTDLWYQDDGAVINFDQFLRYVVLCHFLKNFEEFSVVFESTRMFLSYFPIILFTLFLS
jgi:hypothetical protein